MIHFHNCRNILEHQKNGTHPNDFEYLNRPRMFYNLNFLIETFMIKTLIEFCTWTVASRNPTARQNSYFLIMIYKIEGDLSCDGICMWFLDGSKFEPFSFSLISDRKLITCFELKKWAISGFWHVIDFYSKN